MESTSNGVTHESNCDEAIQAQQDAIEQDIKTNSPLISPILNVSALCEDFAGHDVFLKKLEVLKAVYKGIRRVRRDGNCFYRAFGFAYMEHLVNTKNPKEVARFKKRCDQCRDTLIANGYTAFTVEDFHEQFVAMVERFTDEGGDGLAELEETFNSQAYSDYYVVFLRLFVSAYMQQHGAFYANFIDEGKTVKQFCETEVEPMSKECDNIHVAALALSSGVSIRIENCQQSGTGINFIEFPGVNDADNNDGDAFGAGKAIASETVAVSAASTAELGAGERNGAGNSTMKTSAADISGITLLYRPGHYDILYAK